MFHRHFQSVRFNLIMTIYNTNLVIFLYSGEVSDTSSDEIHQLFKAHAVS